MDQSLTVSEFEVPGLLQPVKFDPLDHSEQLGEIEEDENELKSTIKRSLSLLNFSHKQILFDEEMLEKVETEKPFHRIVEKKPKISKFPTVEPFSKSPRPSVLSKDDGLKVGCLSFKQPVLKEDWLYKRVDKGMFNSWQIKWVVLTNEKVVDFEDFSKNLQSGCLSFKLTSCSVALYRKNQFYISSQELKKKFYFKAQNNEKAVAWVSAISSLIAELKFYKKLALKPQQIKRYAGREYITEFDFLLAAEMGDILLFETNSLGARLQRSITGSAYDHVSIVVKVNGKTHIFDAQFECGVELNDWFEYIKVNDLFEKFSLSSYTQSCL